MEFVGRGEELQTLQQMLQQNQQVAIAAIAGMGGVGKTELALQYAIEYRDNYQGGICWLLPKSGDIGVQIVQFARTQLDLNPPTDVDLPAQVQFCWRRWREGDVLLVLDDVADYQEVKPYFVSLSSRFKILITTRQQLGRIETLSLDVLQPEAALELLKSIIGAERFERENQRHPQVALQLCEWLGYLPLGLELVGRYLARKPDLSLVEMLERLKKQRLEQRALKKAEADMTAQRGVLAAFELSWQELEEDDQQLGCLLSVFAAAPIPWVLVEQCLPEEDGEDLEEIRDDKLLNLYLLQRKGEGIYQLHPLLREFFQYKLTGLDKAEGFKRSFCGVMVAVAKDIPDTPTLQQIKDVAPAIPHLIEVADNLIQYVSNDNIVNIFTKLGEFYEDQGLYEQAKPWYKQCLIISQKLFGSKHLYVAQSFNNLAELYKLQGRYTDAELLLLQAVELTQVLFGEEDLFVATSLNNLAELYKLQGRYKEAEPIFLQALKLRQHLLGEEDSLVATSLNNLAELYKLQERYTEAEPLLLKAVADFQNLLGYEHRLVATSLNNLATLYFLQRRYIEAEPLFLQVLKLRQILLGKEHPEVAQSLNNIAELYKLQGRDTEAEVLFLQALELEQRLRGNEHPNVAISFSNLAFLYMSQHRYTEAEHLLKQALYICECSLGIGHPKTIIVRSNYAIFLRQAYR
ncbi:tetratricopeptide repeat protein [Tolypothrix sp. PCC 7601]|nr:tetratricopeptide repeat protein [Tolypothrix sp. PCC 7601]BAY89456.1 NB-ARC domain-containing protein [Microchaete diplosiphon NIES-3275]